LRAVGVQRDIAGGGGVSSALPSSRLDAQDPPLARAVFLLLFVVFAATFAGPPSGPDGETVFQTTSALARRGSLALGGTPEAEALIAEGRAAPPGGFMVRVGADGESYYGWYGVGQALLGLPLYALGSAAGALMPGVQEAHEGHQRFGVGRSEYFEHLAFGLRNPLLGALLGWLLVVLARRSGLGGRTAFACGLGFGLTTFAWAQSRDCLGDVSAAFALLAALHALLRLRERPRVGRALAFGGWLGLAFLTQAALAPAVLVLGAGAVWVLGGGRVLRPGSRRRLWLWSLLPQVLALALWVTLNLWRFGSPWDSGYGAAVEGGLFGGSPLRALFGLTLAPGRGLLWMAPALVLVVEGARRTLRETGRGWVGLLLAVVGAVLLPVLFMRGWHGAWTYGPRYLLPALPYLWLLATPAFERAAQRGRLRRGGLRRGALVLGLLGLAVQLPGVLVDNYTYHDLAVRAARERFPLTEEVGAPAELEARRFEALQFDPGFAAPGVHWRILRHRVALEHESFSVRDLFKFESETLLEPLQERERGFGHLGWVDLRERLGGALWPVALILALLTALGLREASRALDA